MKKLVGILTVLSTILIGGVVLAQPPEEVPPPPPDTGVVNEAPAAPSAVAPAAAPAVVPVAEKKDLPAPATPPEDKRLKGVTFSPGLGIVPIGFDGLNLIGKAGEGRRYYLGITPSFGLGTSLKTDTDKTVDFSASYGFTWREYYNKVNTSRDFSNDISGSMGMKWNDQISTSLDGKFSYYFKSGQDNADDSALSAGATPTLKFKLNDQFSFKFNYDFYFQDSLNATVDPSGLNQNTNPPDDMEDFRRGSFISDATGFDNFTAGSFGLIPSSTTPAPVATQSSYFSDHSISTGVSYKPIAGTTLGFTYKFLFARLSNETGNNLSAHYVIPSINQDLPWKGGSVSLANEFRFRKWDYATVEVGDGTTAAKQAFRTSLRLGVNQDINDYMSFSGSFRMDLVAGNGDNYSKWTDYYDTSMGFNFKF